LKLWRGAALWLALALALLLLRDGLRGF